MWALPALSPPAWPGERWKGTGFRKWCRRAAGRRGVGPGPGFCGQRRARQGAAPEAWPRAQSPTVLSSAGAVACGLPSQRPQTSLRSPCQFLRQQVPPTARLQGLSVQCMRPGSVLTSLALADLFLADWLHPSLWVPEVWTVQGNVGVFIGLLLCVAPWEGPWLWARGLAGSEPAISSTLPPGPPQGRGGNLGSVRPHNPVTSAWGHGVLLPRCSLAGHEGTHGP